MTRNSFAKFAGKTICSAMLLICCHPSLVMAQAPPLVYSTPEFPVVLVANELVNVEDQGDDVIKDARTSDGQALPTAEFPAPDATEITTAPEIADAEEPPDRIGSRFFVHHQAGRIVGQPNPYSTLGAFYPVNLSDGIVFGQLQFVLDNESNPGGGFTMGRRWYLADIEQVLGIAGSYDLYQNQFQDTLQQAVLSVESRGDWWDVHANGYFPLGPETHAAGLTLPGAVRFRGNNIVRDLLDIQQQQLSGLDLQISGRLGDNNLWAFCGWYHLQGGGDRTDGFLGGVRGYLADRLAMDFSVADDPLFHTNVGVSATYYFGGSSRGFVAPDSVSSRMAEPIQRREVASARESRFVKETQTLTAGGVPITVTHVNSDGPGLGAGTFENPFGSLTDAAGSNTTMVLAHADSIFNGQQYALAPNQRLLGEATTVSHRFFSDQLGTSTLPRATNGTNVPVLNNAPGNAITLASNSEASGFDIRNPIGAALFIDNTVNGAVNVNRTSLVGGGLQATNATGNFQFADLVITNAPGAGILLNNVIGGVLIDRTRVIGSGGSGLFATNVDVLLVRGVEVRNSLGPGMLVQVGGVNMMNATIQNNLLVGNAGPSIFGFAPNAGATLNLNLTNNEDSIGYQLQRDVNGQLRLGGTIGQGGFFNDDNGNVANNGNLTNGAAPNVIISGAGNQIQIIDPATIPVP